MMILSGLHSYTSHLKSIEYTRTLEKASFFLKMAMYRTSSITHFHKIPAMSQMFCPSMKKRSSVHYCYYPEQIHRTCCKCTLCLSSRVIWLLQLLYVMATLYCLDEYIYLGLYDDEIKGCTDRLQKWNQPRKRHIEPRPTDEVD